MKVIATINSALYSGLVKILSTLSQGKESGDVISITDGILKDTTTNGFLKADLKDLFGENSIDILNPAYTTKLMKLLKGGDKFYFLDDEENNKYHITNNIASISILKAAETKNIEIPNIGEKMSEIDLDSSVVATISDAQKILESENVIIHVDNNKIVGLDINGDYEYKFDPETDLAATEKFKLFEFAPLKAEEYRYELYKNGEDYWIKIIMDLSLIEVEYYEKMNKVGAFDGFSLI